MSQQSVIAADQSFFNALTSVDMVALETLLTEDFILVDVFSGSLIDKPALLAVLGSGQLVFEFIEVIESDVRIHGSTAIVVGRTAMSGRFATEPFFAKSRYTHVFIEENGAWLFVSAQGTQIVE